ncbi:activating signal cointegrator 1 complex subunit 2 [Panulirus ornatus]|uniref:activating signal cointegrator 1 complex subunit 2 n=1 Tax=Panulirus ornatus TaxID=150431 RepID=UPI003A845D2A
MSSTGAIPKGGARPKIGIWREDPSLEKSKEEGEVIEPLERKFIIVNTPGIDKRVPALHICWAQKGTYVKYVPPPLPEEDGSHLPGACETWLEQMEFLEQDLRNLLNLPHHKFWSQVVYDPAIHECLESYLASSYRWYEDDLLDYFRLTVESLHHLVFLIYVRMSTYKESETCHITPSVFGDLIYENYLFDICKLLDLCILYGPTNSQLLAKMIDNIFSHQPRYYDDLSQTVSSISLGLEKVEEKLGVAEYIPMALGVRNESLSMADLHNIIIYLLDTFSSLQMFIALHPPAARLFYNEAFEIRISACYERVFPTLMEYLSEQCHDPEWVSKLIERIQLTRSSAVLTFRAILNQRCLAPLSMKNSSPTLVSECVEKFLQVMSTCVEERTFIADYCSSYPLSRDLEFFEHHGGDISGLSFIRDAVNVVLTEMGLASDIMDLALEDSKESEEKESPLDTSGMNGYAQVGSAVPTGVELASMVSSVQDLLPDLGGGFIQECLKYYNYSTEEVINALLEGNLPPSLDTLDRSELAQIEELTTSPQQPCSAEDEDQAKTVCQVDYMDRANVYNDDEFDVFSRSHVDNSRIRKGKKPIHKKVYEADKESIDKVKELARQYDERGGTSIYEDEFRYEEENSHRAWDYEDEYDDTYDDNEARNIDDLGVEKVIKRRPGIIGAGRLNTHIDYTHTDESTEEKSDEEEEIKEEKEDTSHKFHKGQVGRRPKIQGSTRGVQRLFSSPKVSKPKQKTPTPERENSENTKGTSTASPKQSFQPFHENPEVLRQRAEQRRQDRDAYYNRGYRGRDQVRREDNLSNGVDSEKHNPRTKVFHASNRNSGKGWRQGQSGDNDSRGYHGGKYKEDTNHGKAQSQQYRHKMMHKNEQKRQGAQAKFNRNN